MTLGVVTAGVVVVVVGTVVVFATDDGIARLISWSKCFLLSVIPMAAELMSVVLVSRVVDLSKRLVWYSLPGPALDPMVVMPVVYSPFELVRCS